MIASVFGNFKWVEKLVNTWRSQSQSKLIVICYCLNGTNSLDGAKRYLSMYEMKLGENGFVNLAIDQGGK